MQYIYTKKKQIQKLNTYKVFLGLSMALYLMTW